MAKLSVLAVLAALAGSASAFAPTQQASTAAVSKTALKAADYWDPMGLYTLGSGEAFDTFPNMFPNQQYLDASEKKHCRMAMLAWTGIWATHQVSLLMLGFTYKRSRASAVHFSREVFAWPIVGLKCS